MSNSEKLQQVKIQKDNKRCAAYALNMCTVSVSQIIDYKDLNVLEQEYETILNNLNLEQIPKDDALLHILKQLLDTITYFRIETGDKQIIEKEYQQKMKNAIWSAVPNFGMIVAGGNPLTMAVSLASQVGIGYMNYRRNREEYGLERNRQMWQLQRTAIEQFNGLRRELFDTAWRLADTYNFPDEYRLTERQIEQYNRILMDPDELRKYERLDAIKDKFEAYPPFWYFIGNAANYVAGDSKLKISNDNRLQFKKIALEHFEKYEELNKFSILREDQLASSCALEYVDILLSCNGFSNREYVSQLLEHAVQVSGNSSDILEMCAITYLKIGEQNNAAKILRYLINEDYNRIINAQLLSSIYVNLKCRNEYELLRERVGEEYLFPMSMDDSQDINTLQEEFRNQQRNVLKQKFETTLEYTLKKYTVEWNRVTSEFERGIDYPDSYFEDSDVAKRNRETQVHKIYANRNKKDAYLSAMKNTNCELELLRILNVMFKGIFSIDCFDNKELQAKVVDDVKKYVSKKKDDINKIQCAMEDGKFSSDNYLYLQEELPLKIFVNNALDRLKKYSVAIIDNTEVNDLINLEGSIIKFCSDQNLPEPEIIIGEIKKANILTKFNIDLFGPELFGHQAVMAKKYADFLKEMSEYLENEMNKHSISGRDATVYFREDSAFESYFYNEAFENHAYIKNHTLMVIKDNSKRNTDLVFTTDGIVTVVGNKVRNLTPYDEVKLNGDTLVLYRDYFNNRLTYKNSSIKIDGLYSIIKNLGSRFIKNIDEKIEYIGGVVNVKKLNDWFREDDEAMAENVVRAYAIPQKKILSSLGYHMDKELDEDKYLMQFYYNRDTSDLLGMRIVRFDHIEPNFQAYLLENDGFIKVSI